MVPRSALQPTPATESIAVQRFIHGRQGAPSRRLRKFLRAQGLREWTRGTTASLLLTPAVPLKVVLGLGSRPSRSRQTCIRTSCQSCGGMPAMRSTCPGMNRRSSAVCDHKERLAHRFLLAALMALASESVIRAIASVSACRAPSYWWDRLI